jgi:hypothetical protein
MNTRRFLLLPLLAGLAFVAGCDESRDPLGPGTEIGSGSMSFAYTGELEGNFATSGRPAGSVNDEGETWAAAQQDRDGSMAVFGSKKLANDRYDIVSIHTPKALVGSYPVADDCDDDDCAMVGAFFGLGKGQNAPFDHSCTLQTGTVRVESVGGGRVTGTFSGAGSCYRMNGMEIERFDITIANGRFDTALIREQG